MSLRHPVYVYRSRPDLPTCRHALVGAPTSAAALLRQPMSQRRTGYRLSSLRKSDLTTVLEALRFDLGLTAQSDVKPQPPDRRNTPADGMKLAGAHKVRGIVSRACAAVNGRPTTIERRPGW